MPPWQRPNLHVCPKINSFSSKRLNAPCLTNTRNAWLLSWIPFHNYQNKRGDRPRSNRLLPTPPLAFRAQAEPGDSLDGEVSVYSEIWRGSCMFNKCPAAAPKRGWSRGSRLGKRDSPPQKKSTRQEAPLVNMFVYRRGGVTFQKDRRVAEPEEPPGRFPRTVEATFSPRHWASS